MMEGMMHDGGMMWGMGLFGLLLIALVVLAIAALVKYLFFGGRRAEGRMTTIFIGLGITSKEKLNDDTPNE